MDEVRLEPLVVAALAHVFEEGRGGREAAGGGDCGALIDGTKGGLVAVGYGVDLADGAVEQAGDEAEGRDHDPLLPHGVGDVGGEFGVEAGVAQGFIE